MENETKRHRGWSIAFWFFVVAFIGASAAVLIPAFAGAKSSDPIASLSPVFWSGMLGLSFRKREGLSGGTGFASGALVGVLIVVASSFILGYQKAKNSRVAELAEINEQIEQMNLDFPQEIAEGLRADRISFEDNSFNYYLTFTQDTADQLDTEVVLAEQKDYYADLICSTPDFEAALAEGVLFKYHFVDMQDAPAIAFSIGRSDCQNQ